jgi:hypothetical protein
MLPAPIHGAGRALTSCPEAIEYRFDEQPVVARGDPYMAIPPRQKRYKALPVVVSQSVASHVSTSIWLTRYESRDSPRRNP